MCVCEWVNKCVMCVRNVCAFLCTCVCACMSSWLHVQVCASCMCLCVHICMRVWMCVMCVRGMYAFLCTRVHACVSTWLCVQVCTLSVLLAISLFGFHIHPLCCWLEPCSGIRGCDMSHQTHKPVSRRQDCHGSRIPASLLCHHSVTSVVSQGWACCELEDFSSPPQKKQSPKNVWLVWTQWFVIQNFSLFLD